jgi:SAM-dependent methyltransferase
MALGLFPLPPPETLGEVFSALVQALDAHGFTETERLPLPGRFPHAIFDARNVRKYLKGERNTQEVSWVAPVLYRDFARKRPGAETLFQLFTLLRPTPLARVEELLGASLVDRLLELEMGVVRDGRFVTRLAATAFAPRIFFHDCNDFGTHEKAEHVFLGRCSTRLASAGATVQRTRRFERALDLCTGSGIQALSLAGSAGEVVGGDINPRALRFARANAIANGITHATFVESDLFASIPGRFDIVVANTPFLLLHEGSQARSGYGGHLGMEVELRLFEGLDARLTDGGIALVVASSAVVAGEDTLVTRLREIFGGKGYQIRLDPVTLYNPPELDAVYRQHNVDHCILYIVETRKTGRAFDLEVARQPSWVAAAYGARVLANRWVARLRGQAPPAKVA